MLEFLDTRDCSKKSVLGQRLGWGAAKNERFFLLILHGQVIFLNQNFREIVCGIRGLQIAWSPPCIEDLPFYSNFSIREISQKSRFWGRDSVGGWPKMKEFWKKIDSRWSGFFPTKKVPFFNGKMVKMAKSGQNMAYQKAPKMT